MRKSTKLYLTMVAALMISNAVSKTLAKMVLNYIERVRLWEDTESITIN